MCKICELRESTGHGLESFAHTLECEETSNAYYIQILGCNAKPGTFGADCGKVWGLLATAMERANAFRALVGPVQIVRADGSIVTNVL